MSLVRCPACNKALGDREGSRLSISRLGLVIRGGLLAWRCTHCGARTAVDLDESLDQERALVAH